MGLVTFVFQRIFQGNALFYGQSFRYIRLVADNYEELCVDARVEVAI